MSTLLIKSIQILSILIMALCGTWLASDYSVNFARAEISPRTAREQAAPKPASPGQAAAAQTAPELQALALNYHDRGYKSVMVNGQTLHYRRATWKGSPESLLLALEAQIANNKGSQQPLRFSQSGPGWFLAGRLPDPKQASSHGYMLKAEQKISGTQAWIWDFTNSFNASDNQQATSGLPHKFIPIAESKLLFSSQSSNQRQQNWLAGFSAPGSVATHSAYYQAMLEQSGYWPVRAPLESSVGSNLLAYKNSVEEISISISLSADNPEQIINIVQFRKHE